MMGGRSCGSGSSFCCSAPAVAVGGAGGGTPKLKPPAAVGWRSLGWLGRCRLGRLPLPCLRKQQQGGAQGRVPTKVNHAGAGHRGGGRGCWAPRPLLLRFLEAPGAGPQWRVHEPWLPRRGGPACRRARLQQPRCSAPSARMHANDLNRAGTCSSAGMTRRRGLPTQTPAPPAEAAECLLTEGERPGGAGSGLPRLLAAYCGAPRAPLLTTMGPMEPLHAVGEPGVGS
jgi:hypothetical protein